MAGDESDPGVLMWDLGHERGERRGEECDLERAVVRGFAERCLKHCEREVLGKARVEGHAGDVESK